MEQTALELMVVGGTKDDVARDEWANGWNRGWTLESSRPEEMRGKALHHDFQWRCWSRPLLVSSAPFSFLLFILRRTCPMCMKPFIRSIQLCGQ